MLELASTRTFHVSRFTYHVSRCGFQAPNAENLVSRITYHVSRFTFHASRLARTCVISTIASAMKTRQNGQMV